MVFRRRAAVIGFACTLAWSAAVNAADLTKLEGPLFERLREKAVDTTNVSLGADLIKMGANFLGASGDADAQKLKKLLNGVHSIAVRSYEFKEKGAYTEADVNEIRHMVNTSGWSRIVESHNRETGEQSEVSVLTSNGNPAGLFVLCAEPLELTVVYIDGTVSPADLAALNGFPGLEGVDLGSAASNKDKGAK